MPDDVSPARRKTSRRKRDPGSTRIAILEAAGAQLAQDGPEGLSVSQVAQRAGVNRGTAYQHFQTREQLLEATTTWVGERLMREVYGDPDAAADRDVRQIDPQFVADHLARFAMENPQLGRAWLFEVLDSNRAASDPFWKQYRANFEKFAGSELAQPGIDAEVHSVLTLVAIFLWPVWARAQARSARDREQLAKRFSNELLRLCLHGTLRVDRLRGAGADLDGGRDAGK
jgi:AcrR family transcriptional regulator